MKTEKPKSIRLPKGFPENAPGGMRFDYVKRKIICTVSSRRTVIRTAPLAAQKITPDWIYSHFPYGDKLNENTHVFSHEIFKSETSSVFMAALPLELSRAAVEVCGKVDVIDVYERQVFKKYCGSGNAKTKKQSGNASTIEAANLRVYFPLDGGWRVLDISNRLPQGAHFISFHPDFRYGELERLGKPAGETVLLEECAWLCAYFSRKGYGFTYEESF